MRGTRTEDGQQRTLGRGLPNRLWAAALLVLALALYVAANGGPPLLALAALVAAAGLIGTFALLRGARRVVSVEFGDVVLSVHWLGVLRCVDRLTSPRRLHVSAACIRPMQHVDLSEFEVRVVSEEERISWRVTGPMAADEEVQAVRGLIRAAGLCLARDREALRGSLVARRYRNILRYSWPARPPQTPFIAAGLALTFVAMLVDTLAHGAAVRIATLSLLLLGLGALAYTSRRASSARAWLQIDDFGWAFGVQRLWGQRWARGGAAALPGRVVLLNQRCLPPDCALLSRDGAPALSERELTPPEMRWLATEVVDSLDARQRRRRAA